MLFRRMSSVLIVTAAPIVGVIWTLGWFALTGEELNPINGVVAPLALTIGLTDAVHTLLHIRQGIAAGSTPHAAAGHAIREVGAACLLTSLTTAIGFASLEIAEFKLLRDFGRDCAAAVVIAFLAVMTIVPLLGSTWIGRRTVPKNMQANTDQKPRHRLAGTWYMHAVRFSIRNRVAVMIGGIAATILLIAYARNLELDVRVRRGLPIGSPTQLAYLDVDQQFGGSLPFTLLVEWSPDDPPESDELVDVVTAAHNALADSDISSPPLSMLTIFELIPGSNRSSDRLVGELLNLPDERLSLFYDEELGHALIVTRFQDVGSQAITDQLNRLDATLAAVAAEHPQFRFVIPESPPTALRSAGGILFDLLDSLFMAVPVTMLILALALRSLRLGLISMIPNIFPMAALAGTMMVLGIPLQLTGATVFVMCFGIAVDDTIHALTVFRRLCGEGVPPLQAIEQGFDEIGDAIISTTIILIGGISVVILGQSVMTEFFGGLFIGGLLWAFVGDLLLLPAALACFAARQEATTESVQPSGQQSS
ncbi:MAG: hypothetical protein B7Z55_05710 [Planctomycetales bacterium 12-60-4]|nr:MAG: hypothetical protein B7Z55_05710 [Planctomycetales bacterium 12-60-4]